jgi:uncharacterized protein YutE (UPF0331/DUF86 family)
MKSIKQQYIDLQEGKMSQSNFMRNVRMTLPQFITNVTSYNDTVRILKNKGIINEVTATPAPSNEKTFELNGRPVDVSEISFYPLEQHVDTKYGVTGIYYEDKGEELTPEECKEFWAKYKDFVDDEFNEAAERAYYQNMGMDISENTIKEDISEKDNKIIKQVVHDIFKNDVITDKSEVEDIIKHIQKDWVTKKDTSKNKDVYGLIKSYMDSYIQGANDYVSSADEKWGWSDKETDNSIYGPYAKSMVDQAIEDAKEELDEADIYNVAGNPEEEENAKSARIGKEDIMGDDEVDAILKQLDAEEDAKHTAPNIRALKEAKSKWENTSGKAMYDQFKEIDNLNGQEVFTGITCEMENNPELTKKEATKIVIKNLKKQPNYYTDYKLSGVEGYEPKTIGNVDPKTRQMKYVTKDDLVDKAMGMKPVKNVAKAKASANKAKKETNKAKDIDVLSLVAQTLRGVDKMQSQGEKSKTVKLRETIQKLVKEVINEEKLK